MSLIFAWCLAAAGAAEVVWLDAMPAPEDAARVAAYAGATRAPYTAEDLRYAATDFGASDVAAWESLSTALRDVRAFETRLDGELVILRDLARPIEAITLLPDEAARERLFAALAYQGFAVDRYFGERLATDPRGEPARIVLPDGRAVPLPWLDAMAIDPERSPSPYEIAEAPQRAHYSAFKAPVASLLPGLLSLDGALPEGASLVIDGRPVVLDASGQVRLPPGRHFAHLARSGHILARHAFRLEPAGSATLALALGDEAWTAWVADLRDDGRVGVPDALAPAVQALGGEVVVAWTERSGVKVARLTRSGTEPERLPSARTESGSDGRLLVQVGLGIGAGWFKSGDFYLQDPANVPRTVDAVNAAALQGVVDVSLQKGLFRASVIGDFGVPLGAYHVALTGDTAMRLRPDVSLGLGVKWAQVTAGFLFPYHPSVGARITVPVWKGLEVLGSGKVGIPIELARATGGEAWRGEPVITLWAGIGWRFGVPVGK